MATTNPLGLDLDTQYEPTFVEQNVFDLLVAYLPSDSTITPQQAAEKINSLFPYNRPEEEDDKESAGNFLGELWEVMFRLVIQLDFQEQPMQRFVALHKALKELPEIIVTNDSHWINGKRVWQDRPWFALQLHECWAGMTAGHIVNSPADREWKNMNGLLAHFTNEGIANSAARALICITQSLEDDDRKERARIISLFVPAASIWFILCGPIIYEYCQNHTCDDQEFGKKLWKGTPRQGYSIARWEFWRDRFEELSTHFMATEETRQACRAAMDAMDAVPKAN